MPNINKVEIAGTEYNLVGYTAPKINKIRVNNVDYDIDSSKNMYIQDTQPNGFDGIWIADSSYRNYPVVEVADINSLVASSINVVKGNSFSTMLIDNDMNWEYTFDDIVITDNNVDKIKNIYIYYGDGSQWNEAKLYNELDYIQSTGTQYIDTGFYPRTTNVNIAAETKFNCSSTGGDQCVLGARTDASGSNGYKLPNFYNNTFEYQGIVGGGDLSGSYYANTDYVFRAEIKAGSQKFYVNSTLKNQFTASSTCNSGGNLYLLAMHQSGTKWYFKGKLYYCKLWQDDALVRDFIPVKDLNNVACLYDKVSKTFFYNAGSGTFTAGNEI